MIRIFDCFTYFNEKDLLLFRLDYLADYVDFFVIAEATYTHSGNQRGLELQQIINHLPDHLQKKIRLLSVTDIPTPEQTDDSWVREKYQRNFLLNGLWGANPADILVIGDLDEVPNAELLQNLRNMCNCGQVTPLRSGPKFIPMKMFYFTGLNQMFNLDGTPHIWRGSKLAFSKDMTTPELLRSGDYAPIANAFCGWHWSYLGNLDRTIAKIKNFAHQEYNNSSIISNLSDAIENRSDPFGRPYQFKNAQLSELPSLCTANPAYRDLFGISPMNPELGYIQF